MAVLVLGMAAGCYLPLQEYPCKTNVDCIGMGGTCNTATGTCITPFNPGGGGSSSDVAPSTSSTSSGAGPTSTAASGGSGSSSGTSGGVSTSTQSGSGGGSSGVSGTSSSRASSASAPSTSGVSSSNGGTSSGPPGSSAGQSSSAAPSSSLPGPVLTITPPTTVQQGTSTAFLVTSDVDLQDVPTLTSTAFTAAGATCAVQATRQWSCVASISFLAPVGVALARASGTTLQGGSGSNTANFQVTLGAPGTEVTEVTPPIAGIGQVVRVRFNSNVAGTACGLTARDVANVALPITPSCNGAPPCDCTFMLPPTAEGAITLSGTVTQSGGGTTTGVAALCVDSTPPALDGTGASVVRNPLGQDDALALTTAVAVDPPTAGCAAGLNQVARVEVFRDGLITDVLATATTLPTTLDLPGTHGLDDTHLSPQLVFFQAVDRAGNESGRTIALSGGDLTAPDVDASLCTAHVDPLGFGTRVDCAPGAFTTDVCALRAAGNAGLQQQASVAPDGSVSQAPLGVLLAPGTPVMFVQDKCGNTTSANVRQVELLVQPGSAVRRSSPFDVDGVLLHSFSRGGASPPSLPLGRLLRAAYGATTAERLQASARDNSWHAHTVSSDPGNVPLGLAQLNPASAPAARRSAVFFVDAATDSLVLGPGVGASPASGSGFHTLSLATAGAAWSAALGPPGAGRGFGTVEPLSGLGFFSFEPAPSIFAWDTVNLERVVATRAPPPEPFRQWAYAAAYDQLVGVAQGTNALVGEALADPSFTSGGLVGTSGYLGCVTSFGDGVAYWGANGGSMVSYPQWEVWSSPALPWGAQRTNMGCGYDPVRERAIMVGGRSGTTGPFRSLYEVDETPAVFTVYGDNNGPFLNRNGMSVTWDGRRRRFLMFGGSRTLVDSDVTNDLWEYRPAFPAQQFRAAMLVVLPVNASGVTNTLVLSLLARGTTSTPAVTAHVWERPATGMAHQWRQLGTSTNPASPLDVDTTLDPALAVYRNRVVVLLSTVDPSPMPGDAAVELDQAQLRVNYTAP